MKTIFQIARIVAGPTGRDASHPWFIIETYMTSDGPRTRFCDGRWKTLVDAQDELKKKVAS